MKKIKIFIAAALCTALAAGYPLAAADNSGPFKDVSSGDSFYDDIIYVYNNGIMNGIDDGVFEPRGTLTRAMLVTILHREAGKPEAEGGKAFSDVSDGEYYTDAVRWSSANGIVNGISDTEFAPNANITREQLAAIMYRYAEHCNVDTESAAADTNTLSFDDIFDVSEYAAPAMHFCLAAGIIVPRTEMTVVPGADATRAEAAHAVSGISMLNNGIANDKPQITGTVSDIEHHGNITTDILVKDFVAAGFAPGDIIDVTVGDDTITAPYGTDYSDVDNNEPIILSRVDNIHISVAVNMENFAAKYNVSAGDTVTFTMNEKQGYETELQLRSSSIYTFDRQDYASDEVYANFRMINAGDIKDGVIYRSSSPVNNIANRCEYADKLAEENGIKNIINLTDTDLDMIKGYDGYDGSYCSTLGIFTVRTGLIMDSEQFNTGIAQALRHLAQCDGSVLIHDTYGKDQTGITAAILEALAGAGYNEIINDYMLSYENLYHIVRRSEQWQHIADGNIIPTLCKIANTESAAELEAVDLQAAAKAYLMENTSLTEADTDALYNKLCK